ncbi:MAG: endoglucanase [Bacteroidetes bacterium GWF2_38_335]|nr:MAG: endoglucanase [Bacteroidetes bacterium GWF2_38_335]OFY80324.1 MAG: endoglucanase [Bacteroidetes bacterium RIFOXYA12_FULL_38_20]HBS88875.1 endoglucanase [Bacteroidales bacterium]
MKLNFNLLKKISETPGAPGFENQIRNLVIKEVTPLVDKISIDNLGNVTAFKKGSKAKKVMVAAHMDEIGFIVNHIDDNGFLRFHPLGGFDPKTLTAQRVIVHGKKDFVGVMGSKPVHLMKADEKKKSIELTDFFIDLGMTKEEVVKYIEPGNPVTREREMIKMGHCINGKSLDNRISVFILIETLKELKGKKLPYDLYAVFTVQEEVGIRGAQVAAQEIQPDFGFAIDTTIAFDVPGSSPHETVTKLGSGAAIKIMDSSAIADYRMVEFMKKTADKNKIKWQPEILPAGGTDTANIQRMTKSGSIAGAVSVPTRHIHQVIESVHEEDVLECIKLMKACLTDIDKHNWDFS